MLRRLGDRLAHDIRLRFPSLEHTWWQDEDDGWVLSLIGLGEVWASSYLDDEASTERDMEGMLEQLARDAADNLWPDQMTEPWPICPSHGDHPSQVGLRAGRAMWYCLRDHQVQVAIGSLPSGDSAPDVGNPG